MTLQNPFARETHNGLPTQVCSAEERIRDTKTFTMKQCRDAQCIAGLQKSVVQAINRRIRQLKTLEQPVAEILQGNPLVECCRCRHKHHLEQRNMRAREHRDRCPRCRAETWTRAEEQPDIFAGGANT